MLPSSSSSSGLLSLPEDVLVSISTSFDPSDLVSLMLTNHRLHHRVSSSSEIWRLQCLRLLPTPELHLWRRPLPSYLHLCRFLTSVKPLLSLHQPLLWAHQNPELGNLVVVLPNFLSLIAVRILPQELSSSLEFSLVFEIVSDHDGSIAGIVLHGHKDKAYPTILDGSCSTRFPVDANSLLLEVDEGSESLDSSALSFNNLDIYAKKRLLDFVAGRVEVVVPDLCQDAEATATRWEALVGVLKGSGCKIGKEEAKMVLDGIDDEEEDGEHFQISEFLRPRNSVVLTIRPLAAEIRTVRRWPVMDDNFFGLYKLPMQVPLEGRELAGLWGGTFGWPPEQALKDEKGKALYLLMLGYENVDNNLTLIGTKILEGTSYVDHPNGSAMFIVNVGEPSEEPFPWRTDENCGDVEIMQSYNGEGITSGYGFRYPGSKPGSLYVIQGGKLLAFVWSKSKAVLTLKRMDIQEVLKKGERVPSLPPISNYTCLRSYTNLYKEYAM